MSSSQDFRAVESHYCRNWSAPKETLRWTRGPVEELPSDFRVLVFDRMPGVTAYASAGMSQPKDADGLEVHLLTRSTDETRGHVLELLTMVAHYHRTGALLGLGHTVNFGRPWLPESTCSYGLLTLPYLDGPELESLSKPRVRFLWLIPITERERNLKKEKGLDALESLFEAKDFNCLDPWRDSVV